MPSPNPALPASGPKRRSLAKRLLGGFAALAGLGALGIAVLLALMWREHASSTTLPALTGHFHVGRTSYAWVNEKLTDDFAQSPGTKRQVLVWIWYPAAVLNSTPRAEYLPAAWRTALAPYSGVLMGHILTRDPAVVRVRSYADPAVSPERPAYPVVILRAGGGALTTDFTTLAEDLASHGYVVVGFDAPHRSGAVVLPDGHVELRPPSANPEDMDAAAQKRLIERLLPMWTTDAQFVVDQLERLNAADPSGRFNGRLDLRHLGFFGHSFGGATALQFCHDDARCKAGIDLDGAPYGSVVRDALSQPFLFLLSDHGDLNDAEGRAVLGDIRSIYDRLPNGRLLLMIRGANHFSFSDQILLKSQYVIRTLRLFQGGPLPRRGLAITRAYVHTFFDVYLKGAPASQLERLPKAFPEVQPLAR